MSTFVVPDLHGNWRLLLGLLEQEDIIRYTDSGEPFRWNTDVQLVQLGDAANCVIDSINDDLKTIRLIASLFDCMLVGNHEHPYFGGVAFGGFAQYDELKSEILRLNDRGILHAALEVDGILITHAGVGASADDIDQWTGDNKAAEFCFGLNTLWERRQYTHSMFNAVGKSRYGNAPEGSVLWADWSEPKTTQFPQIVGHTVGQTWRAHYPMNGEASFSLARPYEGATPLPTTALCIDVGAGRNSKHILGCWIREGEVQVVEYYDH